MTTVEPRRGNLSYTCDFERDTMAAWEDYQATGLHATQEQVMVWIESWRGPKKKPAPKCHR